VQTVVKITKYDSSHSSDIIDPAKCVPLDFKQNVNHFTQESNPFELLG